MRTRVLVAVQWSIKIGDLSLQTDGTGRWELPGVSVKDMPKELSPNEATERIMRTDQDMIQMLISRGFVRWDEKEA